MDRWYGKVALVTGASSGIGARIAEELTRYGLKVVAIARRLEKLEELKARVRKLALPGQIYPLKCDVQKEEDILGVFKWIEKEFGGVNILVNNAAVLVMEKIIDGSTENFRKIMDVNVIAFAIFIRESVKMMTKQKTQGHIVNINSVAGHNAQMITIPLSLYAASKYAITAMCESVRNELNKDNLNVKITSISPGAVETEMLTGLDQLKDMLPHIHMLTDKDIAEGVIYALSTPPAVEINELTITPLHQKLDIDMQTKQ